MLNTFQSVKELMLGKNYDNILQQSSQGFLFTYDDWSDVVRMEKLQYIDNAQYAIHYRNFVFGFCKLFRKL